MGSLKDFFQSCKKVLDFFGKVLIIMTVLAIEDLCNGSTPDSDSVCGGSNPSSSAIKSPTTDVVGLLILLMGGIRTDLNARLRWSLAATSSKTGGYHNEIESFILLGKALVFERRICYIEFINSTKEYTYG